MMGVAALDPSYEYDAMGVVALDPSYEYDAMGVASLDPSYGRYVGCWGGVI
ncbi:MAG: hypothetical protein KAX84_12625 [Burkholderiales bacterium]|nr:hypothetical protein [Burkholderiales bacterium]